MKYDSWMVGPLRMIEMTGEGRRITAGQRTIRTVIRASILMAPGDEVISLHIVPLALIVSGPDEQYALSLDGAPADLPSLLEIIS